jgi:hypothetical protein
MSPKLRLGDIIKYIVPIQKKLLRSVNLGHGHCNRAAVSRNRYGVEKTADTHTILINAIKCYVCLQEI